eukprot:CAMPEP_0168863340 /NCGR_PEP_ID=MMETSP0727-20121128/18899_1 /TAXON_ID=265536 /ORGANISM="Amphiprora sp., Strain CCMP467" /LENGTH=320 /DNA_ID=CAMNT_0008918405 /DNA_START=42 /DNA_END=1007 /DNA_ORIENTATION=+
MDSGDNDSPMSLIHPNDDNDDPIIAAALEQVQRFYRQNSHILGESHGGGHARAVWRHAVQACRAVDLTLRREREILLAALLHDVDDRKYCPAHHERHKVNALDILTRAGIIQQEDDDEDEEQTPQVRFDRIAFMIDLVSGSRNGNTVPASIQHSGAYWQLIPRWADRLEATGSVGVVRIYQYSTEIRQPLCSAASPRATTEAEVWAIATPERFDDYQAAQLDEDPSPSSSSSSGTSSGGSNGSSSSPDMISHYYNRILPMARPPPDIVQNAYLEHEQARVDRMEPLMRVLLHHGTTGEVDEAYIQSLMRQQERQQQQPVG